MKNTQSAVVSQSSGVYRPIPLSGSPLWRRRVYSVICIMQVEGTLFINSWSENGEALKPQWRPHSRSDDAILQYHASSHLRRVSCQSYCILKLLPFLIVAYSTYIPHYTSLHYLPILKLPAFHLRCPDLPIPDTIYKQELRRWTLSFPGQRLTRQ